MTEPDSIGTARTQLHAAIADFKAPVSVVKLIRLAIGGESDDPPLDVGSVQADRRVDL
jgi:hypothetical protein